MKFTTHFALQSRGALDEIYHPLCAQIPEEVAPTPGLHNKIPLRTFSPGAGLLRNPFVKLSTLRLSRGWVRKDGNLLRETGCKSPRRSPRKSSGRDSTATPRRSRDWIRAIQVKPMYTQGEPLVYRYLCKAGVLQQWRTMWQIMVILDTPKHA